MADFDLNACISGDPSAWEGFVDAFAPLIHSTIRRVLGGATQQQVEDTIQEVFVKLVRDDFRVLRAFDPSRGAALSTYLVIVARSVAIDQVRRIKQQTTSLDAIMGEHSSFEPAVEQQAPPEAASIEQSEIPLGVLTDRQRLVLHLLFDRDLSVSAVADLLNVDEQTIRSTKHKAVERLRAQYAARDAAAQGTAGDAS